MSDSRLEKFIYAICSMDVTDLPVPLSRIEKLWNCLITGETPDFEPLSRNEKYLMAMLDRYDISNLPAPMSRGEKLLYKIAVGETDLSDVPGYLSRYEELLKYLIENGGISGGDFEYVLYTINQSLYTLYITAEKPVKSAILKGQTLVNLSENLNTITISLDFWFKNEMLMDNIDKLKRNTYYTVLYRIENLNGNHEKYDGNEVGIGENDYEKNLPPTDIQTELDKNGGWCKIKFQLTDSFISEYSTYKHLYVRPIRRSTAPVEGEMVDYTVRGFAILEGDYMTNPIPFNEVFEGMQSVQAPCIAMTGKNLWNKKNFVNGVIDGESIRVSAGDLNDTIFYYDFKENQQYVFTLTSYSENKKMVYFRYNYTDGTNSGFTNFLSYNGEEKHFISDEGKTISYISFVFSNHDNYTLSNVQLEEGSVATSYEPYKSNILTTNEDVELRGVGDVRDELDAKTGELTQRVGEIVLDGSEDERWSLLRKDTMTNVFQISVSLNIKPRPDLLSNLFDGKYIETIKDGIEVIKFNNSKIYVNISNTKATTVEDFKNYIAQQPLTIQYQLATESVKTVDLTTVDQDNQPTQLGTFENITHVSLESAGLIPEVEMEVATKLLEDTVFNLTDAFNTLYPTAEKPVVDGTLTGQTISSVSNYTFLTGKYLDVNKGGFNVGAETHRYVETYFSIPTEAKTITLKGNNNYKKICYYDANKNFIIGHALQTSKVDDFKTDIPTNASYFRFNTSITTNTSVTVDDYLHVYLDDYLYLTNKENYREGAKLFSCQAPGVTMTNEDGTKSITLSTPSDLELRKVGEVQDEVNVMTGEVVERIGESILNGNEYWDIVNNTFRSSIIKDKVIKLETQADRDKIVISCDRYPSRTYNDPWHSSSGNFISLTVGKVVVINDANFTTVTEWKQYLSQNPLTIKFVLETPTTKIVDLSITNQDGNPTKLRTFDDTTHVLLKSEAGPNPGASLTVRTKIPSASSTSLLMDDISTNQQQLETTVDEQSNNVDATMIATTEIYEETL